MAACASMDSELRAARESWRGASYDEVVAAWGQPAHSVRSGSQQNHTWVAEDRVLRARGGAGGPGGVVFGGPPGDAARCERTLVFREGRVADEDWAGEPELCKRFARRR